MASTVAKLLVAQCRHELLLTLQKCKLLRTLRIPFEIIQNIICFNSHEEYQHCFIARLLQRTEHIRNVCIIGDTESGKSTLLRSLINMQWNNNSINQRLPSLHHAIDRSQYEPQYQIQKITDENMLGTAAVAMNVKRHLVNMLDTPAAWT